MDDKVRWGVIGSGGIASRRTIPEGILPACNGTLVSVYDVDAKRNVETARQFGARAVGSLDELLLSGIDCVYIASPAYLHFEHAMAVAAAGRHALCEKPLGLTVDEAGAMVAAFRRSGRLLGTAFMMRFQSQHREALRLIQSGLIGRPVHARAQLSCWYPPIPGAWRQDPALGGGGALMDMGGHCLDLLEMFFGPIGAVTCKTRRLAHGYEPEDGALVAIEFENGALGAVDTFFCIPDAASENVLELYGSKGSILARQTIGQGSSGSMCAYLAAENAEYEAQQERAVAPQAVCPQPVNTYRAEIEEFGSAILEGREPEMSGALGLRSQRVLCACYESARSGQTVRVAAGEPE